MLKCGEIIRASMHIPEEWKEKLSKRNKNSEEVFRY